MHCFLKCHQFLHLIVFASLIDILVGCGGLVQAPIMTLLNLSKQTDNPDLPADGNRYVYSPVKAKKTKRDMEKQVIVEKSNGGELSKAAETLKKKIATLKLQKNHQSEIINSKTSSSQEKQRAEEKLQVVKQELQILSDKLNKLHGVSS